VNGPVPVEGAFQENVTVPAVTPLAPLPGEAFTADPGVTQSVTLKTTRVTLGVRSTGSPVAGVAIAWRNSALLPVLTLSVLAGITPLTVPFFQSADGAGGVEAPLNPQTNAGV
jgi:hypothetical protein